MRACSSTSVSAVTGCFGRCLPIVVCFALLETSSARPCSSSKAAVEVRGVPSNNRWRGP